MELTVAASALRFGSLVSSLPGGVAQGLIWGIMALGVYITFRLLDVADLSVDGTFTLGSVVSVMLIAGGMNPWLALLISVLAGMVAGFITGILHTRFGIPAILAGILTQFALFSVNLRIAEGKANVGFPRGMEKLVSSADLPRTFLIGGLIALALVAVYYWYFGTEQGAAIRATGSNPAMSRAQGINIDTMKVIGLALSNGVVAMSGALMMHFQGFSDINMGRGAIVIGLAAVIIGEVLCDAVFRKGTEFWVRLLFVLVGGVVYYVVMTLILWLKLNPNDLKLFTAILVAVFLAVPYLQGQRSSSFLLAGRQSAARRKAMQKEGE